MHILCVGGDFELGCLESFVPLVGTKGVCSFARSLLGFGENKLKSLFSLFGSSIGVTSKTRRCRFVVSQQGINLHPRLDVSMVICCTSCRTTVPKRLKVYELIGQVSDSCCHVPSSLHSGTKAAWFVRHGMMLLRGPAPCSYVQPQIKLPRIQVTGCLFFTHYGCHDTRVLLTVVSLWNG
jgi:hypothetical protein